MQLFLAEYTPVVQDIQMLFTSHTQKNPEKKVLPRSLGLHTFSLGVVLQGEQSHFKSQGGENVVPVTGTRYSNSFDLWRLQRVSDESVSDQNVHISTQALLSELSATHGPVFYQCLQTAQQPENRLFRQNGQLLVASGPAAKL